MAPSSDVPLLPPDWFVLRYNERKNPEQPFRSALDPLVLLAWHTISPMDTGSTVRLLTGC